MTLSKKQAERGIIMNLKTIINIIPFVGLLVMVLWGFLGNAWNISWIAVCVGGILMAMLSVINKGIEKNKQENKDEKSEDK